MDLSATRGGPCLPLTAAQKQYYKGNNLPTNYDSTITARYSATTPTPLCAHCSRHSAIE